MLYDNWNWSLYLYIKRPHNPLALRNMDTLHCVTYPCPTHVGHRHSQALKNKQNMYTVWQNLVMLLIDVECTYYEQFAIVLV